MKGSYPYVIFVGKSRNDMYPTATAANKEAAIETAQKLEVEWPCVEATYMPEDDVDTNDIVYASYRPQTIQLA